MFPASPLRASLEAAIVQPPNQQARGRIVGRQPCRPAPWVCRVEGLPASPSPRGEGPDTLDPMSVERFSIRIGRRSRGLVQLLFGARPEVAWAEVGDGSLLIRYGRAELRTELANARRWRIEGPWRWITAIGIRRSIRHGDVSFAGSPHGGVRIDFVRPVRWGPFDVPAVYVGADDLEAFAAALSSAGIEGEDARRP